jgi:hypothetical protein
MHRWLHLFGLLGLGPLDNPRIESTTALFYPIDAAKDVRKERISRVAEMLCREMLLTKRRLKCNLLGLDQARRLDLTVVEPAHRR